MLFLSKSHWIRTAKKKKKITFHFEYKREMFFFCIISHIFFYPCLPHNLLDIGSKEKDSGK